MESPPRQTGRVKFFNSIKGYGFIIPDDQVGQPNIEEVFVHHTAIYNSGGFKSLSEGEEVEYDLVQGPKGMQAANVSGLGGVPVRGDPYASLIRNNDRYMQQQQYHQQHQQQQQHPQHKHQHQHQHQQQPPPPPPQFSYMPIPYGNVPQGFPQYGGPPPQFYTSSPQMMPPPSFYPPQFPSSSTTSSSTSNNNNNNATANTTTTNINPEGADTNNNNNSNTM
ncbi:cold-shock' DNA-binding domain-containing protein [Zychaea mexicana]|uniref:cold-shock' DNA-binding domain-containing protein n=1 Tax=Zychaea mexicana TaxID=64656 RepID=UPI0022FDB344|nr:cold-shock' DNA-binding domain-containing protein [Zychaea mexicana]KAI9496019.1 cold-shock' DNA-binding domain-containing protein [Zychaea mexicana]